jgi:hypothetical protein
LVLMKKHTQETSSAAATRFTFGDECSGGSARPVINAE